MGFDNVARDTLDICGMNYKRVRDVSNFCVDDATDMNQNERFPRNRRDVPIRKDNGHRRSISETSISKRYFLSPSTRHELSTKRFKASDRDAPVSSWIGV